VSQVKMNQETLDSSSEHKASKAEKKSQVKMNQETLDSSSEHKASKAEKKRAKSRKSKDDKPKKPKKSSKNKEIKKKSKRKLAEGGDFSIDTSSFSLSIGSEVELSSNDESRPTRSPGKSGAEQGSGDPERKPQRPARGKRSADQPRVKSSSVGALDKRKHERYERKRASSSDDDSIEQGSGDPERKPQRPARGKRSPDQPRVKSSSVGALDKRKHERYVRKRASSSDDDSGVGISEISSENETSRLKSGAGQPKVKSKSAGVLERQAQSLFLKRKDGGDDDASSDDDSTGRASRPPRPPRGRRPAAQPRMKSNSVGALDKKKQELSGSNFLKPRKLSSGALKAKAHVQRSVQESSLHMAQPDIKLAIPRVKSKGALNARRTDVSPRRNAKDPLRKWNDSPLDKSPNVIPRSTKDFDVSPPQRKAQSERNFGGLRLATDSPDESSSSDSDDFRGPILPLPLNLRSNREWTESKQADQMPSMDKALSARRLPLEDDNDETWQEALRDDDDDDKERARKRDRKEKRKTSGLVPKKMSSLPQAALPPELLTPSSHKDPKKMSRNLKALLSPGVLQDQKDRRRRERRRKKIYLDQGGKPVRSPNAEGRKKEIGLAVDAVLVLDESNNDQSLVDPKTHTQD
jgi:hypothetical protein